ncbi:long-chain-acyl-CoA synthetase [Aldersonia sp. NBC_00410]|uniref:long-chain-acyl-CoA synthetase n=1 Tax=Aldersonia sp. NBC_00410 TaxID=2975954 RepID=UPI00224CA9AD|nr:long-chain-acyl-CoA synthetase [Aldersonia sp. NBC_00410]MCX5043768.1 long-chain-acyl-CoA synthetase [Aldersonia sp. NBC_00410]
MSSHTVGVLDIAKRLPAVIPDLPGMAVGALGLLKGRDSKWSVGLEFQRAAHRHPERDFLRFEGEAFSYGEANAKVNQLAHVLADRGVERGDVVGVLRHNRPETLLLVLAIVKLGATAGLLNHNQRGEVLEHSIELLEARLLIYGEECRDALESLDREPGNEVDTAEIEAAAGHASTDDPTVCAQILGRDRAFLIFTSGTTGMPKASVMTHGRWLQSMSGLGSLATRLDGKDVLYCCLPLYHNNALTVALSSVLAGGATFALGRKFSATKFWDDAERDGATGFVYIGELCRYLLNQPPRESDRNNGVRLMVGNGLRADIWDEFKQRFGISRVVEFYGASEANIAFVNALNVDRTAGLCPLPHAVVEYDEESGKPRRGDDGKLRRVDRGEVGLLLAKVTDRTPFDGYTDDEATESKLVRDGFDEGDCWFDTGDLVRRQGWFHVAFVDRLGDTYRWKGENVATTEVESAFGKVDSVDEAVVYGVAVEGADGKAGMAAVTLHESEKFDGAAVASQLFDALPEYAVPLFIRVVDSLEQTSTFKSKKVELRKQGFEQDDDSELYVLKGRADGYVEAYEGYADEVAAGKLPKG